MRACASPWGPALPGNKLRLPAGTCASSEDCASPRGMARPLQTKAATGCERRLPSGTCASPAELHNTALCEDLRLPWGTCASSSKGRRPSLASLTADPGGKTRKLLEKLYALCLAMGPPGVRWVKLRTMTRYAES